MVGPGQVIVGDIHLAIGEAPSQERVLALEESATGNRLEQLGEWIKREREPGEYSRRV